MLKLIMDLAKQRYRVQKAVAKARGIKMKFSFQEWYDWWLSNGVDQRTAPKQKSSSNRLEMCRYNDVGDYEIGNVYCGTHRQNMKDQDRFKIAEKLKKPVMTPYGKFNSRVEAGRALGLDPASVGYRIKTKPKEYYYL